jgi:thioredoxin reductase
LSKTTIDVAIIGAGPYGLSMAACLRPSRKKVRIFGTPMYSWKNHMPLGMHLKSEGFASNLHEPDRAYTLEKFCTERAIPYSHIGTPVALETFHDYGMEFQHRFVPHVEDVHVTSLKHRADGMFDLVLASGETLSARNVVIATGVPHFAFTPDSLAGLPADKVSHSAQYGDLGVHKGRDIAVIGGGASALDIAALAVKAGANVELIARCETLPFHDPPVEPRPLWQRLKAPRSGLGTGWRSLMCTDMPLIFRAMPRDFRVKVVKHHLGPAPCWFTRDSVVGLMPMHLGANIQNVSADQSKVRIDLTLSGRSAKTLVVDHVIAGTGYKASVARFKFLDPTLISKIATVDESPDLNRRFESSVPGLYFVGAAAANSFGPMLRFAFGSKFASERVAGRLARAA